MSFNPPGALTSDGWNSFNEEFYLNAPIRYWLDNDFKKIFIYPVKWKYQEITYWFRYRIYDRYHIVKTGLPPGYSEVDNTMLHVNFNLLKDFVEIQQATREYWSDDVSKTWCEQHMPFYRVFYPFRRPDLGIKHLEWATTLDDPSLPPYEQSVQQAKHAREVLILYKWWVEGRPGRVAVEIHHPTNSGKSITDIFSSKFKNSPEYRKYRDDLDKSAKQEERWDNEDDKMLVRLMKIRRGLWT